MYILTKDRTYKGFKIEWDIDECAAPLERPTQHRKENVPPKKKDAPPMNRFHLLNLDDDEHDEESSALGDDDEHDSSGITLPSILKASPIRVAA